MSDLERVTKLAEAFEAWATSKGWSIETHGAEYLWPSVQAGWEAWETACEWQREECAKVCEEEMACSANGFNDGRPWKSKRDPSGNCAKAIRGMK